MVKEKHKDRLTESETGREENVPNNEERQSLKMFEFPAPPPHDVVWTSLFNDLLNIFLFLFDFIIKIHLIHLPLQSF